LESLAGSAAGGESQGACERDRQMDNFHGTTTHGSRPQPSPAQSCTAKGVNVTALPAAPERIR
jgi:hypothetical protein